MSGHLRFLTELIFQGNKSCQQVRMPNLHNAMCDIATQVSEYPSVTYLDNIRLSDGLLSGSIKNAAVVACSDDIGAWVPFACSSPSVQLFLFQNFGHHFEIGGMVETIAGNGIENVVVYGHSDCEYRKFLAKSEESFSFEDEEQQQLHIATVEADNEADWKIVGQYHVLHELKKMLADPVIAPLAANGKLKMHGWFYNSAIRQIEVFDPKQKAFIEVTN